MLMRITMKLSEFLRTRQISKKDAAKLFGCSLMSIYRYLNGEKPNSDVLARIVYETGGIVTIADLIPGKTATLDNTGTNG
jgi:hypothetical protein